MKEGLTILEAIPASMYRKLIKIEDPRPWAGKLPYSHALPGEECLNAIGKGDSVTVQVSLPKGLRPLTEVNGDVSFEPLTEMNGDVSFEVLSVSSEFIEGRMQIPAERPISDADIVVRVPKWAIKDVSFADPKHEHPKFCLTTKPEQTEAGAYQVTPVLWKTKTFIRKKSCMCRHALRSTWTTLGFHSLIAP